MAEGVGVPQKKEVEEKEQKLRQSIANNYSHIKSVENQLAELQLQLNLTSGPKKSALEMLRRKIEAKNELVAAARQQYAAAKQVAQQAEEVLRAHERSKEQLCQELNLLVHQSATAELNKLEQLTKQLESLNGGSFARSHAGPHIVKESEQQQAIADNLPSAEDAAAATTEQQARASNSAIPRLTASNTASSAQAGSAPAAAPAPANSAHVTAKAVQDSSELQQTKQVSQGGDIPNTRQGRSKLNRKQLIHSARTADVAVPQAASDSSGRFRGFE